MLKSCHRLLSAEKTEPGSVGEVQQTGTESDPETASTTCPSCRREKMVIVEKIEALRTTDLRMALLSPAANTS